jgi:hypothetical protein
MDAQASQERILRRCSRKLLLGRNARIDHHPPFPCGGGQLCEEAFHRFLTAGAEARAADQPHAYPTNDDDPSEGRDDVGPHSPAGPVTIAFAGQRQALAGPQARNGRRVNGMHLALCLSQTHRFDREVRETPGVSPIEDRIE